MKELIYMFGVSRLPDQGVSVLICDHPGVGEALRLRGLPLDPRVEQPAAACVDYLESRSEIDGERIGIMALSLGGYYAPRVAAFEPRFSCCVVWGACWDAVEVDHFMRSSEGEASVNLVEQLSWVFDMEPGPAVKMLEHFRVESFMDRISCPILVVHGGEDQQVPSWTAENTYNAAVASEQRELKIFEAGEGASAHCQVDDLEVGTQYMFDWISATLRGVPGAPVAPASSTVPD
jgi:dipeptidyl aminopeptidase/acylaminoacyl peptidase